MFRLGELFCGPGGMALGAGLAGKNPVVGKNGESYTITHVWGVDKDPDAIETYEANVAAVFGGEGICTDATEFVESMTPEQKQINALAFGFPCNDFSLVGDQTGLGGKFGSLYRAGIRVIEQTDPLWFVAENVSGINSADGGKAFQKILRDLKNAGKGYTITANLYKFEEYGVPQYRHRFIIVGIRADLNLKFQVPAKTTPLPEQYISVEQALRDIPENAANMERQRMNEIVVQRLKLTPPWKNAWFLEDLLKMTPNERRDVLKEVDWYDEEFADKTDSEILAMIEYSQLHCKRAKMSHIYKRLQADRPSYTITGSGGGGTHVYHWREHRSLTNRERARIQTFPDEFVFKGATEKVRRQIGMAVPTIGAKIIFENILKTFAGVPYETADTEYYFPDTQAQPASNAQIVLPHNENLRLRIRNLVLSEPKFKYSNMENVYIKRLERSKIIFYCRRHRHELEISAIVKSAELFQRQELITERNLQLNFPADFSSGIYNAFVAIAILDKLGVGKLAQPYAKSEMWALVPLEVQNTEGQGIFKSLVYG